MQAVPDSVLRLPERERRQRGYAAGGIKRFLEQLTRFAEPVDDAPSERLLGGKGTSRQYQLLGAPLANDPRQRLRAAPARHDPDRDLGESKLGGLRCIGEITVQNELESSRVGRAVDCGYHRDRTIANRAKHSLEGLVLRAPFRVAQRIALLQVGARAKRLVARAGQHNAAMTL